MASVTFVKESKSLDALPGTNLRDLALQAGIPLYGPLQRVFHLNLRFGPISIFSASDVVEIEGKGTNNRSDEELKALEGRFVRKYRVGPGLRLASQVTVTGDIVVKTRAAREMDKQRTKEQLGYAAVVGTFTLILLTMVALVGLDLVKKI